MNINHRLDILLRAAEFTDTDEKYAKEKTFLQFILSDIFEVAKEYFDDEVYEEFEKDILFLFGSENSYSMETIDVDLPENVENLLAEKADEYGVTLNDIMIEAILDMIERERDGTD